MTDFKKFIGTSKEPGVGIDRTFNLGYFYATSCCFGLMTDSAVVDSALVDAALRKSGLIANGKE